ncbi:MAG TPA: hypothetical protein PKY77_26560 [Phycisphaerae bacterium]|nr:hypothetical protein [Phycisphaerae bacterium]HRY68447.1 hypothetical protein [Phycisphaerae bacterium]HSA28518.1 hypothetical protein [Phycisphaerae bacterium]
MPTASHHPGARAIPVLVAAAGLSTLGLSGCFPGNPGSLISDALPLVLAFRPIEEAPPDAEPFYLVTLGESVAAGNGLPEQTKFANQVAAEIQRRTGRPVIHQRQAASSATILRRADEEQCDSGCFAESPAIPTSVHRQIDLVTLPERIDLVLLTACINDVGVTTIISPDKTDQELADLTRRFCRDEMLTLLGRIRTVMPQAHIVVTGYYPIVSEYSHVPPGIDERLYWASLSVERGLSQWLSIAASHCQTFDQTARNSLREAVDRLNTANVADPRVLFADPDFGPEHALFTNDPWLWGLTNLDPLGLFFFMRIEWVPEDPLFLSRINTCMSNPGASPSPKCYYTSVGHPNYKGAMVYTNAILRELESAGIVPATP